MSSVAQRFKVGTELAEQEEFERAARQFGSIVQDDPELENPLSVAWLSARMCLADCQGELGDWSGAVRTAEPAMAMAINVMAHFAYLHQKAGNHAQALSLYSICQQLAPEHPDFLHGVGINKMLLGRLKGAVADLARAAKLAPRSAEIWYDFGSSLAQVGQIEEARTAFRKALRLEPEFSWIHADLACLDALEGKKASAFRNLDRAVNSGYRDGDFLAASADLKSLRGDARWQPLLAKLSELIEDEVISAETLRTPPRPEKRR
jgi:tetratricopeptide (TPR) repeat protein